MSDKKNEPTYRLAEHIEFEEQTDTQQSSYQQYEQAGRAVKNSAMNAKNSATAWFNGIAPGYGNTIFFGLMGLIIAVVILSVGFFPALLIAFLVLCGVAFGQWLDGRPTVFDGIKQFFRG